jgi:hypothetical protein
MPRNEIINGFIYYNNVGYINTLAGRMWPAGRSLGGTALKLSSTKMYQLLQQSVTLHFVFMGLVSFSL